MTTKLTTSNLSAETLAAISGPRISNVQIADSQYNTLDDTAANIGGGYIVINGQSFNSAAQVLIDQTPAVSVTWVSNTQIRAQVAAAAEGTSKSVHVINPDGSLALLVNGLTYSTFPAWSTGSTLTSSEALVPISIQLSAPSANNYTLAAANTLPSSVTLYANGLIAGTVAANTTTNYNFTVIAKDNENQDTSRNFTLPITQNIEPVWVTAADLGSVSVDAAYSTTLVATDLSNVTYSVAAGSSLPSSLTLQANGFLSGSVSAASTYSFGIVATDTANLSNTRTFSVTIAVAADTYFKNTTLLLNGEPTVTPFISDASTNSFGLTINGDTKPVLFNPYQGDGYYSNYFDGTGDTLVVSGSNPNLSIGTSNFTIEMWAMPAVVSDALCLFITSNNSAMSAPVGFLLRLSSTTGWQLIVGNGSSDIYNVTKSFATYGGGPNIWTHHAIVRSSGTLRWYINGIEAYSTADSTAFNQTYLAFGNYASYYWNGYLSNFRLVVGTAVYTSAFTPPTTPLTAISGTQLLTAQSNRFIDKSTNNFTLTTAGDVSVSPNIPFTASSSYSTYGSTYFDGTTDYLSIPVNSAFTLGTGDFTIEFYMYLYSYATREILDIPNNNQAGRLLLRVTSNGTLSNIGASNTTRHTTASGAIPLKTWIHVALVRSSGTSKFYINGIQSGSDYTDSIDYSSVNSNMISIGVNSSDGSSNPYFGNLSNFRIVKGTAVYTSAFTPPTSPLTAIANTSLLTLQYNGGATNQAIIDNSTFNNIITRNGNASQGSFSPYSVTGWSNYLNNGYLTVPTNTSLNMGSGAYTIEAWFNTSASGGQYTIISFLTGLKITVVTTGIRVWGDVGAGVYQTATATINVGTWYHVAWVRESTSLGKLYLDGSLILTVTSSSIVDTMPSGQNVLVGYMGDTYTNPFNGYISNLRVLKGTALYTSAFTPPTAPLTPIANTSLLTCQSNRFVDNSPNNSALTVTDTPRVQAFGPFGSVPEAVPISYSNYFDGDGDYLTVANNTALQLGSTYTLEVWCYLNSYSANRRIITDGSTNGADLDLGVGNDGRVFVAGAIVYVGESYILPLSTWTHIAVVVNAGTLSIYINGVSKTLSGTTTGYNHTNSGTKYIGTYVGGSLLWNGYISNLRLVKGTAVYTTNFTPSTTPLTAIANTSLLTCQSTTMIDNSTNAFTLTANGDVKPRPFNPFGYTAQSTTNYTPSIHGGSAYFDGTGDYLDVPNIAMDLTTTTWSIDYWIYPTTISSGYYGLWSLSSSGFRQGIYTDSGTHYLSVLSGGGGYGNFNLAAPNKVITTNNWQHIALTSDGTTIRQFHNGNLLSTGSATSLSASSPTVGSWGGANLFTGYMSNFRVLKGTCTYKSNFIPPEVALTPIQNTSLLLNFNNGGIIDQHGTNVLETVGGAQLSTAVKKYNNASIYFDGSSVLKVIGTHLLTPTNFRFPMAGEIYTIEGWFYFVTLNSPRSHLIGCYGTGEGGWTIDVNTSGNLFFSNGGGGDTLTMTSPITTGSWIHLAFVNTGSIIDVYKDGVKNGTSQANYTPGISSSPLHIGRRGYINPDLPSTAYIDDLRITKGYARYTANFTAPTIALKTR